MQNLHLKNLNNTDLVEYYLNEIDKYTEKIIKHKENILLHLINQLKDLNFKNSKITNYTNRYIESLEKLYNDPDEIGLIFPDRNDFEEDNNNIKKLKQLQDITINSKFNTNNYKYSYIENKKTYDSVIIMDFRNTNRKVEFLELEVENNIIKNIDINIPEWKW